ncbi:MAG: hypothetical protein D6809_05650, partial [Gammaproteobacteria bacterium]
QRAAQPAPSQAPAAASPAARHGAAEAAPASAAAQARGAGGTGPVIEPEWAWQVVQAARYGRKRELLEALDQAPYALEARGPEGDTALLAATEAGRTAIVRLLLEAGADPDQANPAGRTPLMEAAARGELELVQLLLQAGAHPDRKDRWGETALFDAVRGGHLAVARRLLEAGADPNVANTRPGREPDSGYTPLMYAVAKAGVGTFEDWAAMVELLLAHGADPNHRAPNGATALSVALRYGGGDMVALLMRHGAKPILAAGTDLHQLLLAAAAAGSLEGVRAVLREGADPNAMARSTGYATPLLAAVEGGSLAVVRALVEAGADPNRIPVGFRAWTWTGSLLPAAVRPAAEAAARGESPLTLALREGREAIALYLLDQGADPRLANGQAETPLELAAGAGAVRVLRRLLAAGLDPDGHRVAPRPFNHVPGNEGLRRDSPLLRAVGQGREEAARLLLEEGADPNLPGLEGRTPLLVAAAAGDEAMVRLLLKAGADPERPAAAGERPLHVAAARGHLGVMRLLLAAGADPNRREDRWVLPGIPVAGLGRTPLMAAAAAGQEGAVRLLLEAGADPLLRDGDGRDAAALAAAHGHRRLLPLLRGRTAGR